MQFVWLFLELMPKKRCFYRVKVSYWSEPMILKNMATKRFFGVAIIDTDMGFHSIIPLVAFPSLVGIGIVGLVFVLRGA